MKSTCHAFSHSHHGMVEHTSLSARSQNTYKDLLTGSSRLLSLKQRRRCMPAERRASYPPHPDPLRGKKHSVVLRPSVCRITQLSTKDPLRDSGAWRRPGALWNTGLPVTRTSGRLVFFPPLVQGPCERTFNLLCKAFLPSYHSSAIIRLKWYCSTLGPATSSPW